MQINFKKLERMGYTVEFDERKKTVGFYTTQHNDIAHTQVVKLAETLEFNDLECDELTVLVQRIQSFKHLKVAMGC